MSSTVVSARGTRAKAIVGVLAAATLILFGAAPAWAVSYGTVTATATAAPTCTLSGKTYTCSVAGAGSYTGSNGSPASTVYLQVEVWRCPTTTASIAVNGATPSGCTREATVNSGTVPANCSSLCIGSTKASGSATCTATAAYNYFTRSTLWLSTGTVATGNTALLKSAKGC
jgi:hypothetical protein